MQNDNNANAISFRKNINAVSEQTLLDDTFASSREFSSIDFQLIIGD